MTSTVEFINRWQRIALLSQSLLELAQRGEWDLLLQQEVSYLQSIETVMEKQPTGHYAKYSGYGRRIHQTNAG